MSRRGTPAVKCRQCHAEFLRGATAALAHLNMRGDAGDVAYNEIVQMIGAKALVEQARKDRVMRWSGLCVYVQQQRWAPS